MYYGTEQGFTGCNDPFNREDLFNSFNTANPLYSYIQQLNAAKRAHPALQDGWRSVRLSRPFRGDTYEITMEKGFAGPSRVAEVRLDGTRIEGNLVRSAGDGGTHTVRAVMAPL